MAKQKKGAQDALSDAPVTGGAVVDFTHIEPEPEPAELASLSPKETALAPLNSYMQKIEEFGDYKSLTIDGIKDKKGYEDLDTKRKEVKATKIQFKKEAEALIIPYKEAVSFLEGERDKALDKFVDIESDLADKTTKWKNDVELEKARLAREAEERYNNRLSQLITLGGAANGFGSFKFGDELSMSTTEIRSISDELFIEFTGKAETYHQQQVEARIEAERAEKEEREAQAAKLKEAEEALAASEAKLKKQQEEFDAKQAKENKRLADEKAKSDKEQADREAKMAEQQRKLDESIARIEAAEKAATEKARVEALEKIQDRIDDLVEIGFEKDEDGVYFLEEFTFTEDELISFDKKEFTKQAKGIVAETSKRVKEKEAEVARQAKEEADRVAALLPDKEKLTAISENLLAQIVSIELSTPEATAIQLWLAEEIESIAEDLVSRINTLA